MADDIRATDGSAGSHELLRSSFAVRAETERSRPPQAGAEDPAGTIGSDRSSANLSFATSVPASG